MARCSKLILVAVLSVLSACASAVRDVPQEKRANIAVMTDTTVALVENSMFETSIYCTGAWITQDAIITAAHCVSEMGETDENSVVDLTPPTPAFVTKHDIEKSGSVSKIKFDQYKIGVVTVLDKINDIAIVESLTPIEFNHSRVDIECEPDTSVGAHVHSVGHPVDMSYAYSSGYVASVRNGYVRDAGNMVVEVDVLQLWMDMFYGSSGSAVFDDHGCFIGVASFMAQGVARMAFISTKDPIRRSVGAYLNKLQELP